MIHQFLKNLDQSVNEDDVFEFNLANDIDGDDLSFNVITIDTADSYNIESNLLIVNPLLNMNGEILIEVRFLMEIL